LPVTYKDTLGFRIINVLRDWIGTFLLYLQVRYAAMALLVFIRTLN